MIGIGMPMAQASMPFIGVLLWLLQGRNAVGGGLVPCGIGIGQCLTAGWAQRCWVGALYGAPPPDDVLLEMLQQRLPEGVSRNGKQSNGLFVRRTPEHACEGREAGAWVWW